MKVRKRYRYRSDYWRVTFLPWWWTGRLPTGRRIVLGFYVR